MNIKQSYLFFLISTVTAISMRTLMLFFVIDTTSGFIKTEYMTGFIIMTIIIAVSVILSFVFCYLAKPTVATRQPKGIFMKIISPILALVILYDTFYSTMEYSVTQWQKNLEILLAIAAATSLIIFSAAKILGFDFPPVITIFPVLFWLIRLIIIFSSFSSLANITDNIFEMATLCLMLLAFLNASRLSVFEISSKKQTLTFALLISATSLCFITSVSRAIVIVSGNSAILHKNDLPLLTNLVAGLYLLFFTLEAFPVNLNRHRYK